MSDEMPCNKNEQFSNERGGSMNQRRRDSTDDKHLRIPRTEI